MEILHAIVVGDRGCMVPRLHGHVLDPIKNFDGWMVSLRLNGVVLSCI